MLVPADTGEINPVLLAVTTPVVPDNQGLNSAGLPEPLNWMEEPRQMLLLPIITGNALTVAVVETLQPTLLVYVIDVIPPDTPVTKPLFVTEATPGALDCHAVEDEAVPEPLNWLLAATQTVVIPVIKGNGFTVIVLAAVLAELAQPATLTASA